MEGKIKITTVKLSNSTKNRIDKLRSYPKESYDSVLNRMLGILNICKINPEKARARLMGVDRQNRRNKRAERELSS